jgi:hypothetical protein
MNSVKTMTTAAAFALALSGYAVAETTIRRGNLDSPPDGGAVDSSRGAVNSAPSAVNAARSAVERAPSAVERAPSAVESSGHRSSAKNATENEETSAPR